jgi:hypothetical protein
MSKRPGYLALALLLSVVSTAAFAATAPRALLVEGLWSDTFRIREACTSAGLLTASAFKSRSPFFHPNDRLFDMPERLDDFDVVVLVNLDAPTLGSNRLARLRDFVAEGGGLVVLGGCWAFSNGAYDGTPLEAMLPVVMPSRGPVPRYPGGLPLAPAEGTPLPADVAYAAGPNAYFVQALEPKPGAGVWLKAGGQPALIAGSHEKGRVVAVALTVNGEAPAGALAFWDWPDWPRLLGAAIGWASRADVSKKGTIEKLAPLSREDTMALALGEGVSDDVVRRALARPGPESADALFEYAASGGGERKPGLPEAVAALAPYAKAAWAEKLAELAAFTNPDVAGRKAALVLLGATKEPAALPVLQQAVNDKDVKNAALEGMGWTGDPSLAPRLRKAFADAMRAARGGKETGPLLPEEFGRDQAHTAVEAAQALYRLGDEGAVERLTGLYEDVVLYRSIFRNAGKRRVRETDPVGVEFLKVIWDRTARLEATLKTMRRRAAIPELQRAAVVKLAVTEMRPASIEWLVLALERSGDLLSKSDWETLAKARSPVIARLAQRAIASP